jgi:serine protease inhibitor
MNTFRIPETLHIQDAARGVRGHLCRLFLILLALGLMPSCETTGPVKNEPREIVLNKKAAEIIEADQQFAFELFGEVCSLSEEENIMISPLSVSCALGMTMNGSAGTTLDAFYDVLHFGDLTNAEVNESYKDLMDQLVRLDDKVQFSIANSIWYKLGYNVLEDFVTTNRTWFDAEVRQLDFSDPQSVDIINGWIEEKTNDKIQDMLDFIPPDAVMYLINAIYFNAKWKYQFDKKDTYQGNFHLADGSTSPANFMKINGAFSRTVTEDFSAVEMPYGDSSYSMVVILPAEGKTTGDLLSGMDISGWNSLYSSLSTGNVQIELPRFKYGFKDLLNDPLINLGLGIAFSGGADFSRITPGGGLFISRVIHQSFIDVQEEGTEAAAATIVELRETSAGGPSTFRADRPFIYLIKENSTGAILFMGKVGKPVYED